MFREKKSIFERLTGIINNPALGGAPDEGDEEDGVVEAGGTSTEPLEEDGGEAQLTIDVYQTPSEIIIQTMVAGVKPDDLDVSINREMVTIKGRREQEKSVAGDNYFFQELYWGAFARTIVLPEEIDVEAAEASEQNGLLTIRLPKIDRKKTQKIKIKSH